MKILLSLVLATSVIAACQDVTFEQGGAKDLSAFHTYAWKQDQRARYPAIDAAIVEGTDEHLTRKGLRKVDADAQPDLLISYNGERRVKTVMKSTSSKNIWHEQGGTATVADHKVPIGMLELVLRDPKTSRPLWSARANHSITEIDDEKNRKIIRKVLDKMFKGFPRVAK